MAAHSAQQVHETEWAIYSSTTDPPGLPSRNGSEHTWRARRPWRVLPARPPRPASVGIASTPRQASYLYSLVSSLVAASIVVSNLHHISSSRHVTRARFSVHVQIHLISHLGKDANDEERERNDAMCRQNHSASVCSPSDLYALVLH
jgi:hypothetical protein